MAKKIHIVILLLMAISFSSIAQNNEYLIKAGFLGKFANFTMWPESVIHNDFRITLIGKSPFGNDLEKMYSIVQIRDKPVEISYIQSIYEIGDCHILFIANSEKDRLSAILAEINNRPILTVSEYDGFAQRGVMINFYETQQGTIHFEINVDMLEKSNIKMDIMLLDFAKIVNNNY